ncbi:MAG: VPLPA-CTERM sorting domain-containing protein [Rhodobacteraceae bacterium]|nr:VPLPA-CTERM sorting domain-containing protein [Paracoccaceae bacterium]
MPLALGDGLTLNGFSTALLSGAGTLDGNAWYNLESGTSTLGIYANIAAVPLPAAGWLMMAGIGGLAAMRRRRKAA